MSADSDWIARSTAPGVVYANQLATSADIAGLIQPAQDGTTQGFIDNSQYCSGSGSLRFKLRAGINDKNIGGAFADAIGHAFGANSPMRYQWRQRITPEYLTNNIAKWQSSIKHSNIHGVSSTCQSTEYTMVTNLITAGTNNFTNMYTNCGDGFNTDPVTNQLCNSCPNGGPMIQQGTDATHGYNCNYTNQVAGTGNGPNCYFPPSNTWMTYYVDVGIGTYGGSDSTIGAYVSSANSGYLQIQRAAGIPWGGGDLTFTQIRLETYMTEITNAALVDAYVWYQELIISTLPIAAPNDAGSSAIQQLRPASVF